MRADSPVSAARPFPSGALAIVGSLSLHAAAAVAFGFVELAGEREDEEPRVLALELASARPAAAFEAGRVDAIFEDTRAAPPPLPPKLEPALPPLPEPPESDVAPDLTRLVPFPADDTDADAAVGVADHAPVPPTRGVTPGRIPLRQGPSGPPRDAASADANGGNGASGANAPAENSTPPSNSAPSAGASNGVVDEAAVSKSPAPVYPHRALVEQLEGEVTLLALVKADGTVEACEVESSSGHDLLDDAARGALLKWRFKPRIVDGIARPFTARVPFRFSIPPRKADRGS